MTEAEAEICGAITAQRYILENVYALLLSTDAQPCDTARRTGHEMMRQFEDLPAKGPPDLDPEVGYLITQYGLHHLERFWKGVESRLASMR